MKKKTNLAKYMTLTVDEKILAVDPGSRIIAELDDVGRRTLVLYASGRVLACDVPVLRTLAREADLVFRGQPQHAAIR